MTIAKDSIKRVDAPAVSGMAQLIDYDEISEVLRSRHFLQGQYPLSGKQMMRDTVATLDGEVHLKRRRILARLFSDESVAEQRERHLLPQIQRVLKEARQHVTTQGRDVQADLVVLTQRCVYRVAASLVGIDGLDNPDAADRFVACVKNVAQGLTIDWTREEPDAVLAKAMKARDQFESDFFLASLEQRMRELSSDENASRPAGDALELMLRHRDDAWRGDDDLLLRETSLLVNASTQTTTIAFTGLVLRLEAWLRKNPEQRSRIGADPEFLRRAAFESLRMTVSTPARIRIATQDVTLSSGRRIASGEAVALIFLPANEDPRRFGECPEAFDPDRTIAEGVSPWGLAFGGGAHSCPGRPLVTGSRNPAGKLSVDGTLVSLARGFYGAGMRLDPSQPPIRDHGTHYDVFSSVPILLKPS